MKKVVWTLCVDNYAPEITQLTFPYLRKFAGKIGAEFKVITERRFPSYPQPYEKMQISELGKGNDWNIFFDADTLVHPRLFDFTNLVPKDAVMHHGNDNARVRFQYDRFFERDGRNIGSCNWFSVASDWCTPEFWHPLDDISMEDAISRISPLEKETDIGITAEHLLDDYTMSRNIAKYGLKFVTFLTIQEVAGVTGGYYFDHQYLMAKEDKIKHLKGVLRAWQNERACVVSAGKVD